MLTKFTLKVLAGETPALFGDGEQSRGFTFIENVVHRNLLDFVAPAYSVSGKVFNVVTGNRISVNEAVEILKWATGYAGGVEYAGERDGQRR